MQSAASRLRFACATRGGVVYFLSSELCRKYRKSKDKAAPPWNGQHDCLRAGRNIRSALRRPRGSRPQLLPSPLPGLSRSPGKPARSRAHRPPARRSPSRVVRYALAPLARLAQVSRSLIEAG